MNSPADTSIHPVAVRNRVAKAQRIVAFIDANPAVFGSDFGPADAATFTGWKLLATAMGEKHIVLSNLTVATVIGILAAREI